MTEFADRRRSRRLRKKLRVGEFQEFGFDVTIGLAKPMTEEGEDALMYDLLLQVIEPRSLSYAGWVDAGFIAPMNRGTVTEQDREVVRAWFEARPEVASIEVGPLEDAWYGCENCGHDHSGH